MKFIHFLPATIWFLMSLVLLCLPGSAIPSHPFLALIHADKWVHIALFFVLCFLFAKPFGNGGLSAGSRIKWFLAISLAGIAYGTIMEFVQKYWIPNRSFEIGDIMADSVGCLLALLYNKKKFSGKR